MTSHSSECSILTPSETPIKDMFQGKSDAVGESAPQKVRVNVGPEEIRYLLPKALLIERGSTFFAGALGGQFSEAQSNAIDLPEEDPDSFDLFIRWLYHGQLPPLPDPWITDLTELAVTEWSYYGLYCLGEKWCINALKNQTIDRIREYHNSRDTTIHPCHIESCYARTSESSLLRRYVIESAAFALRSPSHKAYMAELRAHVEDSDFLYDLIDEALKLIDMGGFDNPNLRPRCDFHEPVQGNQCCVTMDAVPADPGLEGAFYRVYLRDEELQQR